MVRLFCSHSANKTLVAFFIMILSTFLCSLIVSAVEVNRYNSFAPVRSNSDIEWLIDGHDYFESIIELISSAKSYLYISAWWLTPKVYLRRPTHEYDNEDYRLDVLLKRKADEGVKIYVVLYRAYVVLGSGYAKSFLEGLHPNIHVIRSPEVPLIWSFHEKFIVADGKHTIIGGFDLSYARWDNYTHGLTDYTGDMYPGQEYSNPRVRDFDHVEDSELTLVDRTVIPRMPWHDISMAMKGGFTYDLEYHFVARWNYIRQMELFDGYKLPILPLPEPPMETTTTNRSERTNQVQVVRSASYWNMELDNEDSYYQAHLELIAEAKHYIYIENQYFISSIDDGGAVTNKVGKAIVDRIILAHEKGEKFRVIVVLPILPAFQGEMNASSESNAIRALMYLQYASISRSKNSVHGKLKKAGINPSDYIEWYSLRTFDKITPPESQQKSASSYQDEINSYVTEMVYIHSKIMIVDDRKALVGSANVNDRSLLGDRDAEVGGVVEDTKLVPSYMAGKKYLAGKSILEFRLRLWKEHMGLMDVDDWTKAISILGMHGDDQSMLERQIMDPLSTTAYQILWRDQAKQNTMIYRELFHCVPDDTVSTYAEHSAFVSEHKKIPYGHLLNYNNSTIHSSNTNATALTTIRNKLDLIQGHLVQFPLDYLNKSNMISSNIIQFFTPIVIFT